MKLVYVNILICYLLKLPKEYVKESQSNWKFEKKYVQSEDMTRTLEMCLTILVLSFEYISKEIQSSHFNL